MEESMRKRLEITQARLTQIEKELSEESIAEDLPKLTKLTKERAYLEPIVCKFDEYPKSEQNYQDSYALEQMGDPQMTELAKEERKAAMNSMEALERELHVLLVPREPNDDKNIIVEIRGAVGGDEANLFAGDLLHMYAKYAESQGWSLKLLDASLGAAGGYASVSFMIKGESVYSKMKFESGAHRVQRVPKTESQGRIHTSTATVLVMPEAEEVDVKINPADLKIDTYHSQGAGGQNVNKTESAVRITHLPTGLVVACQTEKAQLQNKEIAMQMIRAKVAAYFQEKEDSKRAQERKLKVGTGERSEKIRTYNYPQNRVTDHRIGFTINQLDRVMEGELEPVIDALIHFDQEQKMLEEGKGEADA